MTDCACGCCEGVTNRTPMPVHNRPGLSAVSYRVGTHSEFLASMVAALTDVDRPALATLTTRDPDDLAIALLDAWAVVGDVLTFHNERLVQESWLRTAVDRRSLQGLGRLVGHRMAPGVAAETHLAFAVEPPPAIPEAAGRDPGVAPPVTPTRVVVPVGTRVQSIPGPDEQPQTFETVTEVVAWPGHNAMPTAATLPADVASTDESAFLDGLATGVTAGDMLLFVRGDTDDHWAARIVSEVIPNASADRTEVTWHGALSSLGASGAAVNVYVFRKRLRVFGHNAPEWKAMSVDFRKDYSGQDPPPSQWPDFLVTPVAGDVIDLDGTHDDIAVDTWMVLDDAPDGSRGVFRVTKVVGLSRAAFAVSGQVTRVTLAGDDYSSFDDATDVREVVAYAMPEQLTVAPVPDHSPVSDDEVVVAADAGMLAPGTPAIVNGVGDVDGAPHAEVAVVEAVTDLGAGRWRITLEADLARDYVRDTVVVHGNVAPATHGETVDEVLGAGRGTATFQQFRLSHRPLTQLSAGTDTGVESTLAVRVNDVAWNEERTLYEARPDDHVFTSTVDEHGDRVVTFGDGVRGARLPTGTNNVRATYRTGLGTAGNVDAGSLAQLLDRPLGLKGVTNPSAASGGVDPEAEEEARTAIPLAVRTLGRAVSLLDYEDYARAWPGISKARATVLPLARGRTIVVTVALDPDAGSDPGTRLDDLATSLRDHGDPHVQLEVVEHRTDTFRLSVRVTVDPDHGAELVLDGVRAAMGSGFSFTARAFLAPVHRSEVVAVAHTVAGVVGVDLDRLYAPGLPLPPGLLADRLVPQQPSVSSTGIPVPAGLLLIADDPFDLLEVAS